MRRISMAVLAAVLAMSACSKSSSGVTPATPAGSPAGATTITVKTTEFAFVMPDTIPAGMTTLHVVNTGGMPHFIDVSMVAGNKTDDDIQTVLTDPKSQHGPPPKWIAPAPFPNVGLLSPGASTDITLNIPAGRYVFLCFMPDANGTPHAYLGMHKVFTATGSAQTTAPAPDFTITADDSGLQGIPDTIPVGTQTIGYANSGMKPAQVGIARILVDKPIDEIKKLAGEWLRNGYSGPPPAEFLGGLSAIAPNTTDAGTTTLNFVPGVYAFIGKGSMAPVIREIGGGGYPSPSAVASGASCTPSGSALTLSVENVAFSTSCLAAPAGAPFTIAFDNKDTSTSHNMSIYPARGGTKALFTGDTVTGPATATYEVKGLPTGTYVFRCDVHPTTMSGRFIVG